ncbi:MAG TPA: amino acid adenylation domain-containing protein, partial [Blastocatellia bacterium]
MHYRRGPQTDCPLEAGRNPATLPDLLRLRSLHEPEKRGYTFLADDEAPACYLTYKELDERARTIAAALKSLGVNKDRALLLYPPGLDFIAAFFGCLYAGIVAVPAYPPDPARPNRTLPRLQAIVADAQATVALTTSSYLTLAGGPLAEAAVLDKLSWLATDALPVSVGEWREPHSCESDLAFLQYTSGSTATPKGVMLTHENLLYNAGLVHSAFEHTPEDRYLSWLPTFHDMGFMAGVLEPLYAGLPVVLMSPVSFLRRPLRWLQAISRYKASVSGGPNFAYDLCVRKITTEERATLDLSSWSIAFNGAEPVRAETLEQFQSAFSPCGFRREAFYPCYGLAEATLIVSGGPRARPPVVMTVEAQALERNLAVEAHAGGANSKPLVSCGGSLPGQRFIIVDPEIHSECPPGRVGEVWVSGPSVADGYWDRPEETSDTFKAYLPGSGQGPFLRTGDLGFISGGELYISGRIKDLLIIRGLNHYPQDIEWTVERCHTALRPGCCAAFSIEAFGEERLVVIQEAEPRLLPDPNGVIDSIREAVALEHELQAYAVTLIAPGSIAKTSSGKIQRHACREAFLAGRLERMAEWRASIASQDHATALPEGPRAAEAIKPWLAHQLAAKLSLAVSEIEFNEPITRYGVDSLTAVELAHLIEANLGVTFSAASLLNGSSISEIVGKALTQSTDASSTLTALAPADILTTEYPLSDGQRGLWFLQQLAPESAVYNIARAVRIKSRLDLLAMRRAFQRLVDRHPCLRTNFIAVDGEPVQRAHQHVEVDFEHCDAECWDDDSLDERLSKEANLPFDLDRGNLLRVRLFTKSADEHILLLALHHIVSDFWSLAVLVDELGRLYEIEKNGGGATLPALEFDYASYVRWQAAMLSSPVGESLRAYWHERLSSELPTLDLPTDYPRPPAQTFRGASYSFRLDEELMRRIKSLSRDHDATLFVTLLAAFQSLLYRYTGQEEILVGSPVSGRARAEWRSIIGYFINLIVVRAQLSADITFSSLVRQTRQDVLGAIDNQDYPFPRLVEQLRPGRDAGRSPLVQAIFILQKSHLLNDEGLPLLALAEPGAEMRLGELELQSLPLEQVTTQFDLTLSAAEVRGELAASIEYNRDLFDATTVERMSEHFRTLLESAVANPLERVSRLPLLNAIEKRRLLVEWNDTRRQYPQDVSLHMLFERRAAQTPEPTALVFERECVSYRELNERANQLAHYLQRLGVAPESLVAICVERGVDMVVSLLAVLKAGCAYVPLDPSYPMDRLSFMLEDSKACVLLTQNRLPEPVSARAAKSVCLDRDWNIIARERTDNPAFQIDADGLAYIIYTSGSTGRPKGAQVSHRAVVNFIGSMMREPGIEPCDVMLAVTSLSFDIAGLELYLPLTAGARVVLASREESSDGARLADLIASSQVTIMQATPATWQLLIDAGWQGSERLKILCGGEALSRNLAGHLLSRGKELWNLYGPTETTIWSTALKVEPGERLSIGKPIDNTRLYLLDSCGEPVPSSVTGELYIGGDGLARGYLNHPGLTAEKFIPDAFSSEPGARLYDTGDLARRLICGDIEFLGRKDQQVKVRGFRIELGEI